MKGGRNGIHTASALTLVFAVVAVWSSLGAAATQRSLTSSAAPPAGRAAPARLLGLWQAHFTGREGQTSGIWHLRIGPGHHLKLWNIADGVAYTPSFEAGPVSFRSDRMVFAKFTGEGVCNVGATYRWTYRIGLLRFRPIGSDGCQPRVITFTPHPWRRSS